MQEFHHSRFHPDQVVCSSPDCQRRRRADYHRKKLAEDAEYRAQCKDSKTHWRENNPDYLKRYRATKKGNGARDRHAPSVDDIIRFLRHAKNKSAKNNSARNNSALSVTSGLIEVSWFSFLGAQPAKNILTSCKVIVLEGDFGSGVRKEQRFGDSSTGVL
jgi:hypothetical protein